MKFRFNIIKCKSYNNIKEEISDILSYSYRDILPASKDALILLKPNLNSNMNALTGNTTDLRILSVLIQFLKKEGYKNILIGEGTNSGFYRNKISVISRLKVDRLAKYFSIKVKDLNYSEPCEIEFSNNIKAQVAKECMDAELFINLPKVKTHFEAGMSVSLKNLIGTLIGQESKKKIHDNLAENILRLNQSVKPNLHIADGLISMEGLGPTKGTPIRTDRIFIGTDPYLIDLACAGFAGFDYRKVITLALAEKKGLLNASHHDFLDTLNMKPFHRAFKPPEAGTLATFIHSPKRQKFFLKIRNTKFFTYLASTDWFGKLLVSTGLRQDVFLKNELSCNRLYLEEKECDGCNICKMICPLGFELPQYLKNIDNKCIYCMYCYSVCPKQAIKFSGDPGFFNEQIKQYDLIIRKLYENLDSESPFF